MRVLGINMGVSSIGWALVDTDEEKRENSLSEIIAAGVRLFPIPEDQQKKESLAAARRRARDNRRRLRRRAGRLRAIKDMFLEYLPLKEEDIYDFKDTGAGTIYKEKKKIDVWQLRHEGLERKLTLTEFARVLTHIAKRRGHFSNRKHDHREDKNEENKKVLSAISENIKQLKKKAYETIGQFFYLEMKKKKERSKKKHQFRIRNTTNDYRHVTAREMQKQEAELLFKRQREFGNPFSQEWEKRYLEVAFYQRPVKSIAGMVGYCCFEPGEKRVPKGSFTAEEFLAVTTLSKVTLIDTRENNQNREKGLPEWVSQFSSLEAFWREALSLAREVKEVKYTHLRKKFSLPEEVIFKHVDYAGNAEKIKLPGEKKFIEKEKGINQKQMAELFCLNENKTEKKDGETFHKWLRTYANIRVHLMRKKQSLKPDFKFEGIIKGYNKNPEDERCLELRAYHQLKKTLEGKGEMLFSYLSRHPEIYDQVAVILTEEKDIFKCEERLKTALTNPLSEFSNKNAKNTLSVLPDLAAVSLSQYSHLSLAAMKKLLPLLKRGEHYDQAAEKVYGHHGGQGKRYQTAELGNHLPRLTVEQNYQLTSPVVKRAVTQYRKIVNAVIKRYGILDSIHIEMTRDLKHGKKQKIEISRGQREYRDEKNASRQQFMELIKREPTSKELVKLQLYNQQNGRSIYSNTPMDLRQVIEDSQYSEIDHILPYSRCFDNSLNNKVLVLTKENQEKGNRTPFEWIGGGNEKKSAWKKFKLELKTFKGVRKAKHSKLLNTDLPGKSGEELNEKDIENPDNNKGVIARNLSDNRNIALFVKNYTVENLQFTDNPGIEEKVKVRSGSLSPLLRYLWGLKEKDLSKHVRHAMDAVVIALSTQGEVKRVSRYSALLSEYVYKNQEERKTMRELQNRPPLSRDYLDEVMKGVIPSFMPRRKVRGPAHEETLYSGKTMSTVKRGEDGKLEERFLKGVSIKTAVALNRDRQFRPRTVAKRVSMPRVDLFRHIETKRYSCVPIYVDDFVKSVLPNKVLIKKVLVKKVLVKNFSWEEMDESYEFICSFYKNDFMEVHFTEEKEFNFKSKVPGDNPGNNNENLFTSITSKVIRGYFNGFDASSTSKIEIKSPQRNMGCRLSIMDASEVRKYEVGLLGELQPVKLPQTRVGSIPELRRIKKQAKERESRFAG